ncbi:MAG: tRNA (adenosine(37)-N6)-threonylcarbamoyltransferase complex ATPase subunit type 1 TsaE [bacterium]
MESTIITTKNAKETQKAGQVLAKGILKEEDRQYATVVALQGELGGGKTTFVQGMVEGLRIKEQITSPTFVILKRYDIDNKDYNYFYHIDCYRLNSEQDILDLDFKNIVSNSKNIIAIEWAEKVKSILPDNTIWINFKYIDKNKREIVVGK